MCLYSSVQLEKCSKESVFEVYSGSDVIFSLIFSFTMSMVGKLYWKDHQKVCQLISDHFVEEEV